jgi:ABC-type uncharacterized transport system permease subunit
MDLLIEWLAASIRLAAPLVLAGVGAVYNERSGVINVGIEGMMLLGALVAVAVTGGTGSVYLATICAMLAGGLLALVHAYLTVTRRADHCICGFAINVLSLGLTNLLAARLFPGERVRVPVFPVLSPPALQELPFVGPVLFRQSAIVWVAFVLPVVAWWVLYRTSWGLHIRAVGEHSRAIATAGLSVFWLRYIGVIISGVCAGLGGSALALAASGYFVPNMTAGRGFVVLAALVVGKWNPLLVAAACLLFGAGDALQLRVQAFRIVIPYQFPVMVPYLLTMAAMIGVVGKAVAPKELGKPYNVEEEA